ncbi:thiosulfate oxidation carrier protein SoxY [Azospirillum sp. RWY-5-1]|uniref:Thiosulfate oxidation carrier protein SoxY n=1 Tax=Azospirillum oleiclasticum TaxID=2735135 RepID=A0ABX2TE95_9PROT|nr:thiosulfate oxidation carrier protein SoxY [Azospirillum oleiclasticum]NYZ15478.1 thiosulfate oxidation carrier protein SoxY [Azospirillum oleiclasticum]NYZ22501.1 thiosulfate oxidation carrier protein SoxY [Azospirillum oleiclasticum]
MNQHQTQRRQVLRAGGGLAVLGALAAAGIVLPRQALAEWNKQAFDAKTLDDAMKAMGAEAPANSGDVQIVASDIAENGAVVPVQAVSKLPKTEKIAILVEKNPSMLAASFDLGPETLPEVTARIKMGQTSNVIVVVKADGKFYMASKEIKVTLGGCGG